MRKKARDFIIIMLILAVVPLFAGVGISFGPGEVIMGNFEIGGTYTITNQFEAINKSSIPVDFELATVVPSKNVCISGYEPLPDSQWVIPLRSHISNVSPQGSVKTGFTMRIPNNKKYKSKKFMFYLQARSLAGGFVGVGANSRVLIQIR